MIVCPELRLIYLHAPKTGGSTVAGLLGPWIPEKTKRLGEYGWRSDRHVGNMHDFWNDHADFIKPRVKDGWTIAGTVRNPWDLMASLYRYHCKQDFETWCLGVLKRTIKVPYHGPLFTARPPFKTYFAPCNRIMRFENLEAELKDLMRDLGKGDVEIHHHEFWDAPRGQHTDRSTAIISELFAGDIKRFGYTPPHA